MIYITYIYLHEIGTILDITYYNINWMYCVAYLNNMFITKLYCSTVYKCSTPRFKNSFINFFIPPNQIFWSNFLIKYCDQIFWSKILIKNSDQIFWSNILIIYSDQIFGSNIRIKYSDQIFWSNTLIKYSDQICLSNILIKYSDQIFWSNI